MRLSRRALLAWTVGAALGACADAASPSSDSLRIVHFSDIHAARVDRNPGPRFPGDPVPKDLVHSLKILEHAVAYTNKHLRAELVIVTGDLADGRKDADSLKEVKIRLDRLTSPYYVVLGNHDHRETYRKLFPGRLNYTFDYRKWHFIGVDSAHRRLEEPTLKWLKAELAAVRGRPTVVMLHHPLVSNQHANYATRQLYGAVLTLKNAEQVQELIRTCPDIKLVLSGHTHLADEHTWRGIHCATAPGLVVAPHCVRVLDIMEKQVRSKLVSVYPAPDQRPSEQEQSATESLESNDLKSEDTALGDPEPSP